MDPTKSKFSFGCAHYDEDIRRSVLLLPNNRGLQIGMDGHFNCYLYNTLPCKCNIRPDHHYHYFPIYNPQDLLDYLNQLESELGF